ncbi:lipopolysaccharide biosynthesis protein [Paenilisteria rocourtiae]|uniref:O-antigen/teichoic acid export membrane protein n=1 Tax=Listeria rocourtiae TaxID=647910 RepID=A0A4R6ZRI7_9LIST|nr:polysaccharide biosynthesis C-terminal domain-containing protein [Listeria rocourtiae]EUJ48386.1 polysaccharide biosynthesis protein [Listeria rocourtiae FSL F6-920]MBC1605878.1 oligosaccharide flippase family protein [Listeria rocourtiae]TDR54759.1 O-antigen/teichoic acid export membrane protein [Listeria rocourtiae]
MSSKYKKLFQNTVLFSIGSMGSKLISLLLVVVFTHHLNPQEYGEIELISVIINLSLPFVTLSIYDAVLRFVIKKNENKGSVLLNGLVICVIVGLTFIVGSVVGILFFGLEITALVIVAIIFAQSINLVFAQYARGTGRIKLYVVNGLLTAVLIFGIVSVLLVYFHVGIMGYFIGMVIAFSISNVLLFCFSGNVAETLAKAPWDSELMKRMLLYSLPLIPNTLMFWVMDTSDRLLIQSFLGLAANGYYAVANKIPVILNTLSSIFMQAWQLTAMEESEQKDRDRFYSSVFNALSSFMIIISALILCALKWGFGIGLGSEFYESWKFVPIQLFAVIFASFSSFLGVIYAVQMRTNQVFTTSFVGAALNIVLNLLLIPRIGLYGAAIATAISFLSVWMVRLLQTRKYVKIRINFLTIIPALAVLAVQALFLYQTKVPDLLTNTLSVSLIFLINLRNIQFMTRNLLTKKRRKSDLA